MSDLPGQLLAMAYRLEMDSSPRNAVLSAAALLRTASQKIKDLEESLKSHDKVHREEVERLEAKISNANISVFDIVDRLRSLEEWRELQQQNDY